jgi:hypothetical protein
LVGDSPLITSFRRFAVLVAGDGGKPGASVQTEQSHIYAAGSGAIHLPSEKHCLTRLDLKAFNRLLGQRSDDSVNIAAISAGRFQSQIGRVGSCYLAARISCIFIRSKPLLENLDKQQTVALGNLVQQFVKVFRHTRCKLKRPARPAQAAAVYAPQLGYGSYLWCI